MRDSLVRFIEAQDSNGAYERAIKELTNGRKDTHWIWYIFPQIHGIGSSHNATYYGIEGLTEAKEYLQNSLLCSRYVEAMRIVHNKLLNEEVSFLALMNARIDCMKFTSSLTLFSIALEGLKTNEASQSADIVRLEKFMDAIINSDQISNFPCERTRNILS